MDHAVLKGLTVALNVQMTALRRHVMDWPEEKLREELALVAAAMDQARGLIGEDLIAGQREAAAAMLEPRDWVEIDPAGGYGLWSESYHQEADNPLTALEHDVFDRLAGEVAGRRVLDVGCGTGRHALRLAAQGAQVTAADPCPEMLAVARGLGAEQGLAVEWLPVGYTELPTDRQYDLVISNLMLCHVPDLEEAIAAMAARLRPGGRLVITDLHYLSLVIGWRTAFTRGDMRYVITNYLHPVSEYLAAIRQAGLELEAVEDILIDERLRGMGMDSVVDKWSGFPFGVAFAARLPESQFRD